VCGTGNPICALALLDAMFHFVIEMAIEKSRESFPLINADGKAYEHAPFDLDQMRSDSQA
jgi:hypothetical protein